VPGRIDLQAFFPFVAFVDRGRSVLVGGAWHEIQFTGAPLDDMLLALWRRDTKEA
jgi:hypothetical protein